VSKFNGGAVDKRNLHTLALLIIVHCSLLIVNCPNPFINAVVQPKTASFETNGGSSVPSQTVYREYPIKRPSNPVRSEHTFIAWYEDNETFDQQWDFDTVPNRDITLYAKWIAGAVAKTDPAVTWPTGLTATCGQTLADISLTGKGTGDGTFTWTTPTASVGAAGQQTHNMTFTPTDTAAYNIITSDVTVTVNRAEVDLAIPALTISGTNANWSAVPDANTANGYTVKIGLNEYPVTGTSYSLESLDVGTYQISVKTNGYQTETHIYNASVYCAEQSFTVSTPTFTTIADFGAWLNGLPANTDSTPYTVKLNVDDLGDPISNDSVRYLLGRAEIFVNIDLSDSNLDNIANNAFEGIDYLTGITFPDNIAFIGNFAFRNCSFTKITIPANVMSIGENAFSTCQRLTEITIPASVTSIGLRAFNYCTNLISVTFEAANVTIGDYAFPQTSSGNGGENLRTAYLSGGAGTYTRTSSTATAWTKQP